MGNTTANPSRPPMKIHKLHGKNLTISKNLLMATRHDGYADAMFFGSRTVDRDEQIQITLSKMAEDWNGSLRFGFTSIDPVAICNHPEGIPRYMCPDLVKRGGSFIETLSNIKLRIGDIIVFWVNTAGVMQVMVNDVLQHSQTTKNVVGNVWPVVDVYGNAVEVIFSSLQDNNVVDVVNDQPHCYSALNLVSLPLATHSRTVELLGSDMARRNGLKMAYIANARPLPVNSVWVILVNDVDYAVSRNLSIAVLTDTPGSATLPETLEGFVRSTVFRDVYGRMCKGDEMAICILDTGSIMVALNGESFVSIGVVPRSGFYWIVADLNCDIVSLKSLGIIKITKYGLPKLPPISDRLVTRLSTLSLTPATHTNCNPAPYNAQQTLIITPNSDTECVICLNSVPDSVFIPCGHVCCCKLCADNMMNEHGSMTCPTCRNAIEGNIRVSF